MKKIIYIIAIVSLGLLVYSCEDANLERTPLDQISDPDFWQSASDLELFLNGFYDALPGWAHSGGGFARPDDAGTDIMSFSPNMIPGLARHLDGLTNVPSSGGGWSWGNIRNVNHFLNNAHRAAEGPMTDHYIGEGHYFRAFFYLDLFKRFGELPIYTKPLNPDDEELYNGRESRTAVMDFILNDLDIAIENLRYGDQLVNHRQRVSKDIALMFKARTSLYAGTWEKYHQGTAFGGETDGTNYLEQAVAASKQIIDDGNYSLIQGDTTSVYYDLFNKTDYTGHPEVLFFKHFDQETHGIGNQIWNWPNAYGWTREALKQFLCVDGQPIGVSDLFEGDRLLEELPVNRDPRLVQSVMVPGDPRYIIGSDTTAVFERPRIYESGSGYESKKFRLIEVDPTYGVQNFNQDFIIMRFAEALLIYAEARAELGQLTQADVDMTINQIRARVGMPPMILGNITLDPNWPDYGYPLPDYLYEIRRERMVELFAEGFRLDDLFRWRAHSLFAGKRFTGIYYTEELRQAEPGMDVNSEGFVDLTVRILTGPNGGHGFNPGRDYLYPIPTNELTLNPNITQNPGW